MMPKAPPSCCRCASQTKKNSVATRAMAHIARPSALFTSRLGTHTQASAWCLCPILFQAPRQAQESEAAARPRHLSPRNAHRKIYTCQCACSIVCYDDKSATPAAAAAPEKSKILSFDACGGLHRTSECPMYI
jgi:hypothetical protein